MPKTTNDVEVYLRRVEEILDGIDRLETDNDGWWETSAGVEFGKGVLDRLRSESLTY